MRRTTRLAVFGSSAAAALAFGLLVDQRPAQPAAREARGTDSVLLAHSSDRLPNETSTDWVTYADHVVAVTPVSEREIAPSASEIERGEGLIHREVTFEVRDVLWSRPGSTPPNSFSWVAHGWQFTGGSTAKRMEMAAEGDSRIESGHTYVMAVEWEEARCGEGDHIPARWRGLGTGSTIPFDNGVLGQGETEGRVQTVAKARVAAEAEDGVGSLKAQMAGKGAQDLEAALRNAQPDTTPQEFGASAKVAACD